MGFEVVLKKELKDMLMSKRFLVLIAIFVLFYVAGFYFLVSIGLPQIKRPIIFLIRSYNSVLGLVAPLLGIAFGYDAISGEREKGTLRIILAQPIYRDSVIAGKLLAFFILTAASLYAATFISLGIFVVGFGGALTLDGLARASIITLAAILLSLVYYSVSLLFSVFSKKSSYSALLSIAVWIIMAVVLPLVATMVALSVAGPPPRISRTQKGVAAFREWSKRFNKVRNSILSVSPDTYFSRVANTFLREIAIAGGKTVSLVDALYSVTPSFAILAIVPLVLLVVSFAVFVKQEEK